MMGGAYVEVQTDKKRAKSKRRTLPLLLGIGMQRWQLNYRSIITCSHPKQKNVSSHSTQLVARRTIGILPHHKHILPVLQLVPNRRFVIEWLVLFGYNPPTIVSRGLGQSDDGYQLQTATQVVPLAPYLCLLVLLC